MLSSHQLISQGSLISLYYLLLFFLLILFFLTFRKNTYPSVVFTRISAIVYNTEKDAKRAKWGFW